MKKISIIIPAYNAQNYIKRAIKSVLNQNFKDYEILVVDDGSTDSTLEILKEFKKEFRNIKIIISENAGPANARNLGLQKAQGKYILFLDADDTLEPNCLKHLFNVAEKQDIEILLFGFYIINSKSKQKIVYNFKDSDLILNSKSNIKEILAELYLANILNQCWGKLFNKEFLTKNHIIFNNEYTYGEDRLFIFECLKYLEKLVIIKNCYYNYIMNENESLIKKFYEKKFEVCTLIDQEITHLCEGLADISAEQSLAYMYIKSVISCFASIWAKSCGYNLWQKYNYIKEIINNNLLQKKAKEASSHGIAFNILNRCIRSKNIAINLILSYLIFCSNNFLPQILIKIKHKK